jgi:ribose transport system substrate-binding protein
VPKAKIQRLYLIPILSKALDIIELLEENHGPVSLEDVYQKTRISKTSVYRILKTLVHRGYVAQTQNGQYRLVSRPRRLRFGLAVQSADLPFSAAVAHSVTSAAAAAGVELVVLDNRFDPDVAIRNAEEFVVKHVDLVLEFQVEEAAGPRLAHIFKKADIPLVAIDVPHPNATYFGVDNFECGVEAGALLAQHAVRKWKGNVDLVLGVGFAEAGSFVQSRMTGAFDGIRERLKDIPADRYVLLEGRGMREPSRRAVTEFLRGRRADRLHLARGGNLRPAPHPARHLAASRLYCAAIQLRSPQGRNRREPERGGLGCILTEGATAQNSRSGEASEGQEAQDSRSGDRRYHFRLPVRNAGWPNLDLFLFEIYSLFNWETPGFAGAAAAV